MKKYLLSSSLGHAEVDAIVQQVICVYEDAFVGQIAGYYIEGSYADQTYLATSDIDMTLVFRNHFAHEDMRKAAEHTWATRSHTSTMEVDITVVDEDSLRGGVYPPLKLGSRLIYGQDVCSNYPLMPIEAWTCERMHAAYWLLVAIYQRPTPIHFPLDFPDPMNEFYGYVNRMIRLPDGKEVPCTRNLVRTTGWIATALLALQARQYVARKRDCARLYSQCVGDSWASLLEEIFALCRDEWHYLLPVEQNVRQRLRRLCEQAFSFEQHFMALYKPYLLEQLRSTEQEQVRHAMWVQEQLPINDEEIRAILQTVRRSVDV